MAAAATGRVTRTDLRRFAMTFALVGLFGLSALAPIMAYAPAPTPARAPVPEASSVQGKAGTDLYSSSPDLVLSDTLEAGLAFRTTTMGDGARSHIVALSSTQATDALAVEFDRDAVGEPGVALLLGTSATTLAADDTPAPEPGASPPAAAAAVAPRPAFALLLAASQETAALLGLGPQPGIAPPIPQPSAGLTAPTGLSDGRAETAMTFVVSGASSGWLRQAAWTVALASFGILCVRGLGLALALFSRFDRGDVLGHERRARLFEAIQADPGIAFGRLRGVTGWAPGVVQHHLRLLEQHGVVRRVRDGRTTHFFPAGTRPAPTAALAPARRSLLETLRNRPGLSLSELAAARGRRPQSVWDHLDRLRNAGLVEARRDGRGLRWRVTARGSL